MSKPWSTEIDTTFDRFDGREIIPLLTANRRCAVRVRDFLGATQCAAIVSGIEQEGVSWYPGFEGRQGRIGLCATEYHAKESGKTLYFSLVDQFNRVRSGVYGGDDPLPKLLEMFGRSHKTSIACEPGSASDTYYVCLIRAMNSQSTLHYDFAPHQLPGWWTSSTEAQFAAVIYLQMPDSGGELSIYNFSGSQTYDSFNRDRKEKGPNGYDTSLLTSQERACIVPRSGDLILFNSKNFHQVGGINSERPRYSVNSFISVINEGLYVWN